MTSVARRMKLCGRHASALSSRLGRSSNHLSYLLQCFYHRTYSDNAASLSAPPMRVAIIGSGPAGFYAARRLLSLVEDVIIDMYERLPVPFGLVRFGVAPDHPEVKNCQATFTEVAESPRFNFIGNIHVGAQLPIQLLVPHYHALLFAYGASKDRELGLQGEKDGKHIYSARAFVGWYNGLGEYRDLSPDLTAGEDAVIVGQGNVALDVARTLLTDVDALRKTDMTEYALEGLSRSRIKNIHIVGRRGPVQAAFTIKEIREMMQLPNTSFRPIPETLFPRDLTSLPRPQRRLLELLKKGPPSTTDIFNKSWSLDFLLLPHSLHWSRSNPGDLSHVQFLRTELAEPYSTTSAILQPPPSSPFPASFRSIPASTLFRSIGYKSEPLPGLTENGIPFDVQKGIFPNDGAGRVVSSPHHAHTPQEMAHEYGVPIPGLYCAGWVKRGPTGVIASTMADAFITADAMVQDWKRQKQWRWRQQQQTSPEQVGDRRFIGTPQSRGWEGVKDDAKGLGLDLRRVSWEDWEKIDAEERRRGKMNDGKPREKIPSVEDMLRILD